MGVIGWLYGGSTALQASAKPLQPSDGGFRVAVAFCPGCRGQVSSYSIPVLLLLGEADDWTPAAPWVELAQRMRQAGMIIEWTVYPGASHGFDVPRPSRVYLGHYLNYSPGAASDTEARVRALLAQHLGAGGH